MAFYLLFTINTLNEEPVAIIVAVFYQYRYDWHRRRGMTVFLPVITTVNVQLMYQFCALTHHAVMGENLWSQSL